jgi:CelD/BcsL family acetyltransferase involved in cellulose biosynthesis
MPSQPADPFTISEISDIATFDALADDWHACASADPRGGFFSSHAWFSCCIHSFGAAKQLKVLVLRDGSRVIAIAPLWRQSHVTRGVQVRKLSFIDVPDTHRTDFIVAIDDRDRVMSGFVEFLLTAEGRDWDLLELARWPETSPNLQPLRRALLGRNLLQLEATSALLPFVRTNGSWDAFLQSKSPKFRKTHRNIINRVERLAGVKLHCLKEPSDVPLFDALIDVSSRSWKHQEGISLSASDETRRFFERLTDAAAKDHAWLGWVLEAEGRPIAMEYDLVSDGTVYALRSDFDEGYKDCSPGAYLEHQILKFVFDMGFREYNAGPGLNPYKLRWAEDAHRNIALTVYNRNLKARALGGLETMIVPAARKVVGLTSARWRSRASETISSS